MMIRSYQSIDETGWIRCRVLSFLDTAYYDNVLKEKEKYDHPSIELVAELDGHIVGLLDIELENSEGEVCSEPSKRSGMIWHIAVHPDFRRNGIASRLLQRAEELAKEKGIERLEAWTRDDQWVREWYERKRFEAKTSYLHIYQEGTEIDQTMQSTVPKLTPLYTFSHYTGPNIAKFKQTFKRVHECIMYEKLI